MEKMRKYSHEFISPVFHVEKMGKYSRVSMNQFSPWKRQGNIHVNPCASFPRGKDGESGEYLRTQDFTSFRRLFHVDSRGVPTGNEKYNIELANIKLYRRGLKSWSK